MTKLWNTDFLYNIKGNQALKHCDIYWFWYAVVRINTFHASITPIQRLQIVLRIYIVWNEFLKELPLRYVDIFFLFFSVLSVLISAGYPLYSLSLNVSFSLINSQPGHILWYKMNLDVILWQFKNKLAWYHKGPFNKWKGNKNPK